MRHEYMEGALLLNRDRPAGDRAADLEGIEKESDNCKYSTDGSAAPLSCGGETARQPAIDASVSARGVNPGRSSGGSNCAPSRSWSAAYLTRSPLPSKRLSPIPSRSLRRLTSCASCRDCGVGSCLPPLRGRGGRGSGDDFRPPQRRPRQSPGPVMRGARRRDPGRRPPGRAHPPRGRDGMPELLAPSPPIMRQAPIHRPEGLDLCLDHPDCLTLSEQVFAGSIVRRSNRPERSA
jgi:hypothetical protein